MNAGNPGSRFRNPPNGLHPGSPPIHDHRNGHIAPLMNPSSSTQSGLSAGSQQSRAEKFEDQKRRIIESCFNKKEPDGAPSETYITHVSITEDGAYTSVPPPANSPPENKKKRVIIVAVKKSGRVRMHKARENEGNGTFSIGKTWVLDDLSTIESFTNANATTPEQYENKQRAGSVGFVVTVGKPYYWQAATAKEKEFFIFSLIKIYRKYTGGRLPELRGFAPQEMDQFGGPPVTPMSGQPRPQANGILSPNANMSGPDSGGIRPVPLEPMRPEASREKRPRPTQERAPTQERPLHSAVPQERTPRNAASQERMIRGPPSQERPFHSATPQDRQLRTAASQERLYHSSQERPLRTATPHDRPLHSASSRERSVGPPRSNERIHLPGSFPSSESIVPASLQPGPKQNRSPSPSALNRTQNQQRPLAPQQKTSRDDPDQLRAQQGIIDGRPSNERLRRNAVPSEAIRTGSQGQQLSDVSDPRPGLIPREPGPPSSSNHQPGPSSVPAHNPGADTISPPTFYGFRSKQDETFQNSPVQSPDPISAELPNDLIPRRSPERLTRRQKSMEQPESIVASLTTEDRPSVAASLRAQNNHTPMEENEISSIKNDAGDVSILQNQPAAVSQTTNSPPTPPPEPTETEVHRPGLGPMIKKKSKKDIATTFRRAANAANAFKSRPSDISENPSDGQTGTGDGITGVFQAPSLLKGASQDDVRPATPDRRVETQPSTPQQSTEVPPVKVITSPAKAPALPGLDISRSATPEKLLAVTKKPEIPPQDERRKKLKSEHSAVYAKALGIDPSLLEGRTSEIESILDDFGWGHDGRDRVSFEDLQAGIRREIARVEAGNWVGTIENNDERITAVGDMMDKVIAECDELDCLLTLYNVELGTLSEDVAYIEAQSQGLQVQTANQKLLHTELKNLLDTISISASDLKVLRDASLAKVQGIQEVEHTLVQLYTAMITIDPNLRQGDRPTTADQSSLHRSSSTGYGGTELGSMHAVREKKEGFRRESIDFLHRLKQYLSVKFREMEAETMEALEKKRSGVPSADATKLDDHMRDMPKQDLWMYSPLMLFAREIEPHGWSELMRMYEGCAKKSYQEEFRDNIFAWKRITRKMVVDEQEFLFTTQEKENESLVGRKLTVRRGKTLRADGSSRLSSERLNDGKVTAYEAFAGALTETARIIFIEQNFIVDLFHASSLDMQDFVDATTTDPESRKADDLIIKKPFDPDRDMAKKVVGVIGEIYAFWPTEIQNLVDWVVKQDALSGVGVLFALESQLSEIEETNQEFLSQSLTKIHDRLATQFTRFIEEQIRGIEDTKVKIKKRKGVISFMKTFPIFCLAIENMLPHTRSLDHLPIRGMVNDAYQSLNKAMFESLKFIAKESPTATQSHPASSSTTTTTTSAGGGAGDPEDKEALNHHILLIENMNHYVEEVSPRRANPVLDEWSFRARAEMSEHLDLYLSAVIRRPLGKLLDFLESTESLIASSGASSTPASTIASRASHSRSVAKKVLGNYDGREIRRGVETLKKRIEKHFGDGGGEGHGHGHDSSGGGGLMGRELVGKVLREGEGRYLGVLERVGRVVREVYSEGGVEVGWGREDVLGAFAFRR